MKWFVLILRTHGRGPVAATILLIVGLSCGRESGSALTIQNDFDFTIAISRCDGKNALDDPLLVSPGSNREIHAGTPCIISGPATKSGVGGGILNPGSYIGCLLLPATSEGDQVTLRASSAVQTIGERACDEMS
jgi:hypothetical protein